MITNAEIDQTLSPLRVSVQLTMSDCVTICYNARLCGCMQCLVLADRLNSAMINVCMDAQLSPAISWRLDQRLADQRTEFRIQILGKAYLDQRKPALSEMGGMPERLSGLFSSLDLSQPLDDLLTAVHAAAERDRLGISDGE